MVVAAWGNSKAAGWGANDGGSDAVIRRGLMGPAHGHSSVGIAFIQLSRSVKI